MKTPPRYDTVILGAGAAGMMCAAHCGGRTLVLDHARAPGEKIRISGGGRCNFTNLDAGPANFLSQNPHFAKSALARYTQWDFIDLVGRHAIAWHEKTLGQLFCDDSAKAIITMLLDEMKAAGADLWLEAKIDTITKTESGFQLEATRGGAPRALRCTNLVIATGGKSIPKMGATGMAYRVAEQFGLNVVDTRPALVPLTFGEQDLERLKPLAGLSVPARVRADGACFEEGLLFTHRGLSGPSILQASSYWREGKEITVQLEPQTDILAALKTRRASAGRVSPANALAECLPKRLAQLVAANAGLAGNLADQSDDNLARLARAATAWSLKPTGSEGYRTAEVTLGGVDTNALDARTMMARQVPGLYFIGEAVDVTGWLGGYNFQWAWSSGWAAGTEIAQKG